MNSIWITDYFDMAFKVLGHKILRYIIVIQHKHAYKTELHSISEGKMQHVSFHGYTASERNVSLFIIYTNHIIFNLKLKFTQFAHKFKVALQFSRPVHQSHAR